MWPDNQPQQEVTGALHPAGLAGESLRESPVMQALNKLAATLEGVNGVSRELRSRLQPVLGPDIAEKAVGGSQVNGNTPVNPNNILYLIETLTEEARKSERTLRGIIERVQV